ncbi:MAG: HAMP domain-containing sensor histidine kinase [Propionicimonas sp.]
MTTGVAGQRMAGRIRQFLTDESLDFRARLFNVAAAIGFVVALATALESALNQMVWQQATLNLAIALVSLALLWFVRTTGRYRLAYLITVVVMFLVVFPALFFSGGGYLSGMPAFFVFALVFSAFVLEGTALWILVPLQVVVYAACCVVAYLHPATVTPISSPAAVMTDVIYAVTVAGVSLAITLHLLLRVHQRNQELLAVRNAQLQQVDRAKSEFLAGIAHELNTPLAAIRAHAEAAERRQPTGSAAEHDLSVIGSEADRLGRLVRQLLDIDRINEDRLDLDLREENLGAIVQQTLRAYQPLCARTRNSLELARGSASPMVMADRERVAQVLVNLLSNAARHTSDGVITVAVRERGRFAEVSVTDTGEGIPAELLTELASQTGPGRNGGVRSARDTGIGLGLTISRSLVSAHGGELTLTSELGVGTTARCAFPLANKDAT